jgi:hypothetical protein
MLLRAAAPFRVLDRPEQKPAEAAHHHHIIKHHEVMVFQWL